MDLNVFVSFNTVLLPGRFGRLRNANSVDDVQTIKLFETGRQSVR